MGQKDQLPSATFSLVSSFLPQNDLSEANSYDWLGFNEIRKVTESMAQTTSLVVVAMLDTGIYEDHPNLQHHILKDQSDCFVLCDDLSAKDLSAVDDLRVDRNNHGTMVAGIIVLKGPENVRIVNLKVLHEPGKETNIRAVIDALNYLKDLKIKDHEGREHRVHIVNMSVGRFLLPEDLEPILRELAGDMVLIASAGFYGVRSGSSFAAPHAAAVAAHVLVAMEAKEGPEYRKSLCKSVTMKSVLKRMRGAGVLQPWNECFRYMPYLYGFCQDALVGR